MSDRNASTRRQVDRQVDTQVDSYTRYTESEWMHQPRPRFLVEEVAIWILGLAVLCAVMARVVCILRRCKISTKRLADVTRWLFPDTDTAEKADQDFKAFVKQRSAELKAVQLRIAMQVTCVSLLPVTASLLVNVTQGGDVRLFTPPQEIMLLVLQAVCALPIVKPALVTPASLDVFFLGLILCCCLAVVPLTCCKTHGMIPSFMLTNIMAVVLNLVRRPVSCRELPLSLFGNALYVACTAWSRSWLTPARASSFGSLTSGQALQLMVVMAVSSVCEAGSRRLLSQGLQLAETREMYNAACALLRSCYDVVVQLDSSGCVEGASLDLGSLLLRSDGNRTMHGVAFAGLIADEEERANFLRRLADPKMKSVGLAENMHMGMKDSLGNILRVEAMWFDFKRADGDRHFMVGVREFSDLSPPASCLRNCREPVDLQVLQAGEATTSSSEESMSQPEVLDTEAVLEEAMLVIDLTGDDWRIRGVTSGFRSQVGHVPRNAPLSRIVKRPDALVRWMQNVVNAIVNEEELPEDHKVVFRMPQRRVKAQCRLVVPQNNTDTLNIDDGQLPVLFYSISDSSLNRTSRRGSAGSWEVRGTPANSMIKNL